MEYRASLKAGAIIIKYPEILIGYEERTMRRVIATGAFELAFSLAFRRAPAIRRWRAILRTV